MLKNHFRIYRENGIIHVIVVFDKKIIVFIKASKRFIY